MALVESHRGGKTLNVDFKSCFGRGQTNSRCEGCGFKEICRFVCENFISKESMQMVLDKISEIEAITRGE